MLTYISSNISPKYFTSARNADQQQHQKYDRAAEDVKEIFTPLLCSADSHSQRISQFSDKNK